MPDFIAETGIAKIRESVMEQENLRKAKQKARDKLQPKMGKIDIDYQVLHDAFFKYQKKPRMSGHGDLYYEGKEFEVDLKAKKAGALSSDLMNALGLTDGGPPPWLINMQRFGPPPSYPSLRIPGLNAPIPPGAQFGYQPGGWGKPPVDEFGRPLYGDVFGSYVDDGIQYSLHIDKSKWGELQNIQEEPSDDEEEEEEEGDELHTGEDDASGMATPSSLGDGMSSTYSGLETPVTIDLRKRAGTDTPDTLASYPRELYHVIQEKKTSGKDNTGLFGTEKTYILPGKGGVEMSINPDQLETALVDQDTLQDAYDADKAGQFEDDKNTKRKRRQDTSMAAKRQKDFKF